MGALARAVGALVGGTKLGSVSDAVVSGLHSGAVAVARRGERPLLVNSSCASSSSSSSSPLVKIAVVVDGSPASRAALLFACRWVSGGGALAGKASLLLLISAPQSPPFPFVFDDAPSSAVAGAYGAERWEEEKEAAATAAKVAVEEAAATAVARGVERASIETAALGDGSDGKGGVSLPVVEALNGFV